MEKQDLFTHISNLPQVTTLLNGIKQPNARFCLTGCAGSLDAFVAAEIATRHGGTHVFILNDREEASYFLNDLQNIYSNPAKVLFFPSTGRNPYLAEEVDNANILMRAECLNILRQSDKTATLIVSYPEAFAPMVVTRKNLEENTLEIQRGKTYSIDFIDEVLLDYDFEKVDYVYEPGQFSVRGGIVDVYSFSHEDPYRIEFFGDEVESIRSFDALTQLSNQSYDRISVLPNVQQKILFEAKQSFFDFIPNESVLWLRSVSAVPQAADKTLEKAKEIWNKQTTVIKQLTPEEMFVSGEEILRGLLKHTIIETGIVAEIKDAVKIQFNASPQPSFNKNMDMFIRYFHEHAKQGYKLVMACAQKGQVERLYAVFTDKLREIKVHAFNLGLREGFIDHDAKLICFTDHQVFDRYYRFRLREGFRKVKEAVALKEILGLQKGDYVTHIDYGIGQYSGLETIDVNGKKQEAVRLIYKGGDIVYVSIHSLHRIARYTGKEGTVPQLHKLGSNTWQTVKNKTKKKVKEIAYDLIQLYARRKSAPGYGFTPDTYLQHELEASFIYEDTPDQVKATRDVKKDMEQSHPMDRLICGDVGFGKTEIAIRAAFKAVAESKQVAILVPTTILSLQHYKNFVDRLEGMPCNVDYINRFKSAAKIKESLQKLKEGKTDIIIGTHRLVSKDVVFKDLGLLVIDEEQKFGVSVKDKLKLMKENVDTLTLTATPIPRTLQFSLMGARDLSVINTPPPNRYPVQTEVVPYNEEIIRDRIMYEVQRGGQVFFIHNRVQNIGEIAGMIQRLCPGVRVAVGHGKMDGEKLEAIMVDFMEGMYDVLLATTIIESGIDIANANTIIINDAQNFGLSDLHQLRGRVGRSNKHAFCILMVPSMQMLTREAKQRLNAIEQFSELGSGFSIAMRDLDIRGAGNLLGGEQSGFITDIGYETYQKILDEALHELKENEFRDLYQPEKDAHYSFVRDCVIETDMEILIPHDYVNQVAERLSLYRELDDIKNDADLDFFRKSMQDRFGPIPAATSQLIETVKLRWIAQETGIEKLILKQGKMTCNFVTNEKSPYYNSSQFTRVLSFVQIHHRQVKMEEKNGKLTLTFPNVKDIANAIEQLQKIAATPINENVQSN